MEAQLGDEPWSARRAKLRRLQREIEYDHRRNATASRCHRQTRLRKLRRAGRPASRARKCSNVFK
ncbi:MAG: hypothetical protein AB7K09_20410 [Planctomycetota bacterium]